MKKMKQRLSYILPALILTAALSGCSAAPKASGSSTSSATGDGSGAYPGEEVTFDWYINYSWFNTEWGQNAVSKAITEKTGVNINFITPQGNEEEKLNSLIAGKSLPDLITLGWWEPKINEMIQGNMVYALNELADKYDPYFWKVADDQAVSWYTQADGNIYGYPCSSVTPDDVKENDNIGSNQTFLVRKDIYEAIGSPDMTTPEGFENAVKKAAKAFPEIGGKPLIPIGAHSFDETGNVSFDKYMQNFLAVPYEKDGKLYDRYTDPEYIEWLKMFNRLSREGYLSTDVFIDQRVQMEEKIAEGRYFCMMYQYTDLAAQQKSLYTKDPNSIYIAVDGPKNSRGDDHVLPTNTVCGWTVTMVSKNCKNPERAIEFIDYMISEEGQKMVYLGIEGVTYDVIDGKEVVKPEVMELLNSDRASYDAIYGADDAYWMFQDNVMQLKWRQDTESPTSQLEEWTYKYAAYTGQYDIILPADSDDAVTDDLLKRLWGSTLKELLLARSDEDFDRILEIYKTKRDSLGYRQLMEKEYQYVIEAKKKLGLD